MESTLAATEGAGAGPALDLRPATDADQPQLASLYRATRDDLTRLGDSPAIDALIAMQQRVHADGLRRHPARQLYLNLGFRPGAGDELFEPMRWDPG